MYYNPNPRNRKLKNKLFSFVRAIMFQILHLGVAYRIVTIGMLIMSGSLCVPWFMYQGHWFGAFHGTCGRIGYAILLGIMWSAIIILLGHGKEKIKAKANLSLRDYSIVIFIGVLLFFLALTVFNTLLSFSLFTSDYTIGKGSPYALIGSAFMIVGWILHYIETKHELIKTVYIEHTQTSEGELEEYKALLSQSDKGKNKNMTLPI